ncbi:MAG: DUF2207 domain-containing protein [Clostridiales bacterium]|nr:DUF2207 domain-containing protein [Clostridiales bacterium]
MFFIGIFAFASLYGDDVTTTQTIDTAFSVEEMRVDVDWNNDRSCKIKQYIDVEFSMSRHGIIVDIPVNSGERVRNIKVSARNQYNGVRYQVEHSAGNRLVSVRLGDSNVYMNSGEHLFCTIEYDYLTPEHPENKNALDINPIGYGWPCYIHNATVTVNFPTAVQNGDVSVWVSGNEKPTLLDNDGKTIIVEADSLDPFHGVRVKAIMPNGALKSGSFEGVITVVVGAVLLVVVVLLMVFVGKDKALTPVVSFYPPQTDGKDGRKRRMLPVQLGKIIDGTCSASDVTSLIFYWASEGYISIEEKDENTYITKLNEIDPVTEYERVLFTEMFKKAKRNKKTGEIRVSIESLSGSFADKINAVKTGVNNEYRGKFYSSGFTVLSVAVMVVTALFAVLGSVLCTLRIASGFFNLIGVVTLVPVVVAGVLGSMLVRNYFKLSDNLRKTFLALYLMAVIVVSIAVMLAVPTDAMVWTEKAIFAVCIGASAALAPFLTRRTDSYTEQLNEIIGFRNFLRDAEKEQLEMMLQEDPQYYYDILPYANVLGVSKIWQDKFQGLSIEPPTYYHGSSRTSIFDLYVLSRLSNSMASSLSYTPPKASSGSFSGGSFGGGSSGGGSFGGFGGGGGRSW